MSLVIGADLKLYYFAKRLKFCKDIFLKSTETIKTKY